MTNESLRDLFEETENLGERYRHLCETLNTRLCEALAIDVMDTSVSFYPSDGYLFCVDNEQVRALGAPVKDVIGKLEEGRQWLDMCNELDWF